jgi:hypothetical protein
MFGHHSRAGRRQLNEVSDSDFSLQGGTLRSELKLDHAERE